MRRSLPARVALATAGAMVVLAGLVHDVSAQTPDRRFTQQVTEGTTYVVAFPQLWSVSSEKPTPTPLQILISGRQAATVTLSAPGHLTLPPFEQTVSITPGRITRVTVPTGYMSSEPGKNVRNAITVRASAPISVSTRMAWNGGGEDARHLPVSSWGTEYRTFNLYQDRFGSTLTFKHRPGQILIIAQQAGTEVSITPTVDTEAGPTEPSIPKGTTRTVRLEQGETFLIRANIDVNEFRSLSTDLSGTHITSNKPIGVVSGHTKGAILRMPDVLPPTGMFVSEAHFVRNGIHEALLPVTMAGTRFVTVPVMYTSTRVTGNASMEYGMDDDRGDVIRIMALEDNTVVQRTRADGSSNMTMAVLDRGEVYSNNSEESAAQWITSKPAMAMQYGKCYAKVIPPSTSKDDDETQGQPSIEAGMPMMQVVPPVDRWTSRAAYSFPGGLDNFMNIVFKTSDVAKIEIDGERLVDLAGSMVRRLAGTDYSYVRMYMAAGDHVIESVDPDVTFGAWAYGSLDGLQQGRAYGTCLTVNAARACAGDSITIDDEITAQTGEVSGMAFLIGDAACANTIDVYMASSTNYTLSLPVAATGGMREMPFLLTVVDPTKDATAVVHVTSPSGKVLERTYTYKGSATSVDDTDLEHGLVLAPNPVNDVLHVQGIDATARVQIVTMAGADIDMPASDRIDVSSLPPGPYMLKVVEGGMVRTARFMVVR